MNAVRGLLIVAGLSVVATGCWDSGGHRASIRLTPGNHTLRLGDRVDVGDKVICMSANGEVNGGASVPERGRGVGSGAGFGVSTTSSGEVEVECPLGDASAGADRIVLTGQTATRRPAEWATSRRVEVTCGAQPNLCGAIAYFLSHRPHRPCIYRGIALPRRVVVAGTIDGRPIRAVMGVVCNPPVRLAQATEAIYVAAFGPASHLVVHQTFAGSSMYVEGSMSYVKVSSQAGSNIHSDLYADPSKPLVSQAVAPGSYTVESWQRPCDGNCGSLDPATDRCTTTVTIAPGRSTFLVIVVTSGDGCTIEPRAHG